MTDEVDEAHRVLLRYPKLDALVCRYLRQGEALLSNDDQQGDVDLSLARDSEEPQED